MAQSPPRTGTAQADQTPGATPTRPTRSLSKAAHKAASSFMNTMSHTPEQPHEVPWREVEHDMAAERIDEEGRDMITGLGRADYEDWWGTPTQARQARRELLEREKSRAKLGGFGFRQEDNE